MGLTFILKLFFFKGPQPPFSISGLSKPIPPLPHLSSSYKPTDSPSGSTFSYIPKNDNSTPSPYFGRPRPFSKNTTLRPGSKTLRPGFYFRKKSSLSDFIADSMFDNMDMFDEFYDEEELISSIVYDPSLDEIYGSYLNSPLIKSLSLETPIKGNSKGPKINQIIYTNSVINSQGSGPSMSNNPLLYSYVDALSNYSTSSPLLSKNFSRSSTSESSSTTKAKRKRRKKPGSDRRYRKWCKKSNACFDDLHQVLALYRAEHISKNEAKIMLKHTIEVSKTLDYCSVPYILAHTFGEPLEGLWHF